MVDVGCGNGTTTQSIARALSSRGLCTGIDLSKPMILNARARALAANLPIEFIHADVAEHPFRNATFDVFASRFGVMFFADPVKAFANLRSAASGRARLVFIVWRGPEENAFVTAAQRAAAPLLPKGPVRDPEAPGPFSLANPDHVRAVLSASGWTDIELRSIDMPCAFKNTDLDLFLAKLVPIGHDLQSLEDHVRAEITRTVRAAYESGMSSAPRFGSPPLVG
ncbi:MAG: class I SAM-dependent methyltransferase [Geminicoccaceae bacterium]